jgi:VIT1/CCC1 family predicted Fe2+/Mn2+ transporter
MVVIGIHAALALTLTRWHEPLAGDEGTEAIIVDLAPFTAPPTENKIDLAPHVGADLARMAERARSLVSVEAPGVTGADLRGGLAILVLVFFSTLPVALPFLLMGDLFRAARVSDAAGIVMLFVIGTRLGSHAGRRPLVVGLTMVGIGVLLSAIAIRLGG